jgi:hypothetical protein
MTPMADMPTPDNLTDERLLEALSAALDAHEPIPADAVAAAYAAFGMSQIDALLAELVFDSADAGQLVGMRAAADTEARMMTFVNDHLTVDFELHADGRTIVGQLDPVTDVPVDIEREDGSLIEVAVDEFGRFRVAVPSGPMRLRVHQLLVTPWIER